MATCRDLWMARIWGRVLDVEEKIWEEVVSVDGLGSEAMVGGCVARRPSSVDNVSRVEEGFVVQSTRGLWGGMRR